MNTLITLLIIVGSLGVLAVLTAVVFAVIVYKNNGLSKGRQIV